MVEALARLVVRDKAGLRPLGLSYAYYVAAYRTLATAAGVDVEALLRTLWQHRTGEVRAAFVDTLDTVRLHATGQRLAAARRGHVQAVADQLFATARVNWQPAEDEMDRLWRMALS
jgi:hypothetical protein